MALKQAIEANDASQIMKQMINTQLAVEKEKARLGYLIRKQKKEEETKKATNNVQAEPQTAESSQPTQITPKAKKWAEENGWFGTDSHD